MDRDEIQEGTTRLCSYPSSLKSADDSTGEIEAVVAVFNNVDAYGDKILPGAFTKSLARKLPRCVWMHDWKAPVAKTVSAIETAEGLQVKGMFNLDTQRGREAYSDVKKGLVDEFSIGFYIKKWTKDEENDIWELVELDLVEWSPVLVGANPATRLISVKSGGDTLGGLRFEEHSTSVLAALEEYVERASGYAMLRSGEGRALSDNRISEFKKLRDALSKLVDAPNVTISPESDDPGLSPELKALQIEALREMAAAESILLS